MSSASLSSTFFSGISLPSPTRTRYAPTGRPILFPISSLTTDRPLRAAVVGGGPAGSSAAEALAAGGVETFLIERSPSGSKPCGGAIPLCMLSEFSLPSSLVDRRVSRMRLLSPSNLVADFSRHLRPGDHIPMLRREVLDSFLRGRAESRGAVLLPGLVTALTLPASPDEPYLIRYISSPSGISSTLAVDVVVGADGANSRVARSISAGSYSTAIAFQERIRLPPAAMAAYSDLAEMYVGGDVSPDFYGWVFPKCDHVAVGTGTVAAKREIKRLQSGIRSRAGPKIAGGEVIRVEAHPIPEHPRPRRVVGRAALVGDAAGYVTRCSGEGIYFAAKSGRMCGEAIVRVWKEGGKVTEEGLKREYLKKWDDEFIVMFRFLDLLQRVFYGSNAGREALVELCGDEYVQRMTFDSYLHKRMVAGDLWKDFGLLWKTMGSLVRATILEQEVEKLRMV
ncbi:geranylgeranyl diphosphate reductase, chloroplastic-like [Typha latifolia]|uniref:geranylgeranyl diphosphate reductase, chloroplastic-like n=1 Tax=Typha latifolia TaxID=4733 RepID=UPI003C2CD386